MSTNPTTERAGDKVLLPATTVNDLMAAFNRVVAALRDHPHTDSATALRRFLWSLYNGDGWPNLYRLGCVLDDRNSKAAGVIFAAYMAGHVKEDMLRLVLEKSGEFKRLDAARREAKGQAFEYPPLPEALLERAFVTGAPASA